MNAYDGIIAVLVVLGMIWGSWKGFTSQLATVASLALGYLFAYPLADPLSQRLPIEPPLSWYVALVAAYLGISAIVFIFAALLRLSLRRWKMEDYDKHLGMLAGGAGAFAVGLVLTLVATSLIPSLKPPIAESPTGRFAGRVFTTIAPILPKGFREVSPFDPSSPQTSDAQENSPKPSSKERNSASASPPSSKNPTKGSSSSLPSSSTTTKGTRDDFLNRARKELREEATRALGKAIEHGLSGGDSSDADSETEAESNASGSETNSSSSASPSGRNRARSGS